jgi:hypothetical protein
MFCRTPEKFLSLFHKSFFGFTSIFLQGDCSAVSGQWLAVSSPGVTVAIWNIHRRSTYIYHKVSPELLAHFLSGVVSSPGVTVSNFEIPRRKRFINQQVTPGYLPTS